MRHYHSVAERELRKGKNAVLSAPCGQCQAQRGDLNAKIDNLSLEALLASIKQEWAKLGPMSYRRGRQPRMA
jgi:hypothetical protein